MAQSLEDFRKMSWNFLPGKECSSKATKVVLLGQPGVGKTALAVRFATKRFIGEYDCSIERTYKIDGPFGTWEVVDPPGNRPLPTEPNKLRCTDAVILVYSVTDPVSFHETSRLRFLVTHATKSRKGLPIVLLVGNKADLSNSPEERIVSLAEGRTRAEEIGAHGFHEISVRESHEQVTAVFVSIARLLLMASSGQLAKNSSFRHRSSTIGSLESMRRPPATTSTSRRFSISARGAPH